MTYPRQGEQVGRPGAHAPEASQYIAGGRMQAGQVSHVAPHVLPWQAASGVHVTVTAETHWSCASHAVGASVGTGQFAGSTSGGQ
jgi:hypothetical protein